MKFFLVLSTLMFALVVGIIVEDLLSTDQSIQIAQTPVEVQFEIPKRDPIQRIETEIPASTIVKPETVTQDPKIDVVNDEVQIALELARARIEQERVVEEKSQRHILTEEEKILSLRNNVAKLSDMDSKDADFKKVTRALYDGINSLIDSDELNGELEDMIALDDNPVAQKIAIWGFGNLAYRGKKLMPGMPVIDRMMILASDDRSGHRAVVAEAFDRMRDPRFRGVLEELAQDSDKRVKGRAQRGVDNLKGLKKYSDSEELPEFTFEASPHPHWNSRRR